MEKDKQKDEYPKLSVNDKQWKQQEEFDSTGDSQQLEDEDKNALVQRSANPNTNPVKEENKDIRPSQDNSTTDR